MLFIVPSWFKSLCACSITMHADKSGKWTPHMKPRNFLLANLIENLAFLTTATSGKKFLLSLMFV